MYRKYTVYMVKMGLRKLKFSKPVVIYVYSKGNKIGTKIQFLKMKLSDKKHEITTCPISIA